MTIVHHALKHYKSTTVRPLSTILQNTFLIRQNLRPNEQKYNLSTASSPPSPPSSTSITLYQYAICPFCHKVKTLLAYASQSYDTIEVNPLNKRQIKELPGNNTYRKVPIALIDSTQYNGSDDITSTLLNHHQPTRISLQKKWENSSMTMPQFHSNETWTTFATEKLGTVLYPNICKSLRDSYDAFRYVEEVDDFSTWEKVTVRSVGSLAMYFAAGKIKSKHGIKDEKKALDEALALFSENGLDGGRKEFASGTTVPDLGDLSVFGTLYSIERLEGLHERILEDHSTISDWYTRMKGEVYGRACNF